MLKRRNSRIVEEANVEPKGFDDFELRQGDLMRGERATMGKSLLDVQRELRIKASYIAAIENADPSAFDTPGFIAGYVRSYARYLGMDPEKAFAAFCAESGFAIAHGMSEKASSIRKNTSDFGGNIGARDPARDPLMMPATPFAVPKDSFLSRLEPGAISSMAVLVALIGAIGFGGWTVLHEIQRVQYAPVENTPSVLSDLDPLESAAARDRVESEGEETADASGVFAPPSGAALDRLYRPRALDVPVVVARDAPISTLDPASVGSFVAGESPVNRMQTTVAEAEMEEGPDAPLVAQGAPQVVGGPAPQLAVVAARPAWVRVRGADGSVIYEGIMDAGDSYVVPPMEEAPTLRVGESGAVYFAINGAHFGPVGPSGSVTSNIALSADSLVATYEIADMESDRDLARVVAELQQPAATPQP